MWWLKFIVCVFVDLFDMTVGRLMFAVPFAGEVIGVGVAYALFGPIAFAYALEILDPTEQLDGFIPTASIIALMARKHEQEV
ncbi:hypothetical protein ACS3SW_20695 [Roseobacteraceae bacterium S113]